MAIYRAVRNSPYNNWRYRMDIVPYDENLSGNGETLPEGSVVEFGDLEYGFDDVLPYGLANPATWSLTLNFSRLPDALQTRLRNKYNTYSNVFGTYDAYNTFLFWTDSGTNGATWTLLFCGVVENAEGASYDVNENGELETTYNLVDGAYHSLLQVSGNLSGFAPNARVQNGGLVHDYPAITGGANWRNDYGGNANAEVANAHFITWSEFCLDINTRVSVACWLRVTRFTNSTFASNNFDNASRLAESINTGVRLKGYNTNGSGDPTSTYLDKDNTYLLQYIIAGGEKKGGMYSTDDEYGISRAQCVKDILSDICETFCVKMYWAPEYVTDAGGDYIRWNLEVASLLGNKRSDAAASSYSLNDVVSIDSISEGAGIIGRAETRVALVGDDKNITELVTADARSRTERSINIEPIFNNLPTPKTSKAGVNYYPDGVRMERQSIGIDQTNCLFTLNATPWVWGGSGYGYARVHHNTRVVVRGVAGGGTQTTYYEANSATKPVNVEEALHVAWMNEIQRNAGIPKALTKALYETFSKEAQSEVVLTWRTNSNTLLNQLGAVHNLTNGVASTLTQYSWNKACVTKVVHSFGSGTSEITYFLPGV